MFLLHYHTKIKIWGLLFTIPALTLLICFIFYPMIMAIFLSFTNYELGSESHFVGLTNYIRVITGHAFIGSLHKNIIYVFGTVIPVWLISFGLAILLSKVHVTSGVWRTLLFLPTVIPLVTSVLVWKLLFHYYGVVNSLLGYLHIGPIGWLTQSTYAQLAMIITSWWHASSYYMILFLAGLLAIPSSYKEAAQIDGASAWQTLIYIILPLMRPIIVLVVVLSIVNGFRTFALQKIMTGGGPGTATEITTLLIYKTAFNFGHFSEAAAISVIYFSIILIFSLIQLKVLKGGEYGV